MLQAQSVLTPRAGFTRAVDSTRHRGPSLVTATLASALIPGAGQTLLGKRRAILYAAAEVIGVAVYASQHGTGNQQRTLFHDLARTIARARFHPDGPVGDWDYYERMEKYASSGAFDVIPGGTVDPETDPTTYNGSIWLLARQTYWRDPEVPPAATSSEFQNAMSFYAKRAVTEEMRWSWIGSDAGLQRYQHAIASSNNAFRRAEQTLGLVIANHFLSAVDAFVTVKLRARQEPNGRLLLTAGIPIGTAH
jgi:hypothetical protein